MGPVWGLDAHDASDRNAPNRISLRKSLMRSSLYTFRLQRSVKPGFQGLEQKRPGAHITHMRLRAYLTDFVLIFAVLVAVYGYVHFYG